MNIIFVLISLIFVAQIPFCIKMDRKKSGLIWIIVCALFCSITCLMILNTKNINNLYVLFSIYYSAHAMVFAGISIFVYRIITDKYKPFYKLPVFYMALMQNGIMLYNVFTHKVFTPKKHIMLGANWWITTGDVYMRAYNIIQIISGLIILAQLFWGVFHTARLFRTRLYFLFVAQFLYVVIDVTSRFKNMPQWIIVLLTFPSTFIAIYFSIFYADKKLKDNSLISFADELSEGFVLYDSHSRLIYVNGFLKRVLSKEVIKSFSDIDFFRGWTKEVELVNDHPVKKILVTNADGNQEELYYSIEDHELIDNGICIGHIFDLKDMTNATKIIRAMEEVNAELERTAQMKSDFLANMSHELRTPMNAVIGMSEMILRENIPPQAADYVRQIKVSGQNLLNIINDILDFSKIESGKLDIVPGNYEPSSMCHDIASTLSVKAKEKDLELIVNIAPDIPSKLFGDCFRIRQVLINLANNAIKFTREGSITINVSFEKMDDDRINLIVHCIDTGMGIRPDDLKKLFVSFQQVDSKRNRNIEGTGLGLAISKSLIETMGGQVGVTSEYGRGSDFYFNIPQQVVDAAPSMVVEKPDEIRVAGLINTSVLKAAFESNMQEFKVSYQAVEGQELAALNNITHMFFDEILFNDSCVGYLETHKDTMGIVICSLDSQFNNPLSNVRVLKRPVTTLMLSKALNNQEFTIADSQAVAIEFSAPEASVLIVDDNSVNLAVAEGLLEPVGMKIDTALSAKKAIELLQHTQYDIIFMDHMMPEMDGIEAAHYIREQHLADDTPIIALTANAVSGARELFLQNGFADFISKPIEIKAILGKVHMWLPEEKIVLGAAVQTETVAEDTIFIPGIDTAAALTLIGSPKLYKKVAGDYFKAIDKHYEELTAAYSNQDIKDYTIKVHALKSSSRQIGAMELAAIAEALEKAGNDNNIEFISANHEDMLQMYRKVQELLTPVFGAAEAPKVQAAYNAEEVRTQLDRLDTALEELDMDEMEAVSEYLGSVGFEAEQQGLVTELIDAIAVMDMDNCEALSKELRNLL